MTPPRRTDLGLLALRAAVGATLAAHGAQKLLGWFGGAGLEATAAGFDQMGFRPGKANAVAAGLGEAAGGALLAVGLGTPLAGAAVAGTMAVAASVHAPQGFFSTQGGYEYPAVLGAAATALAITGPGRYSLDEVLGHRLGRPWMGLLAFVGGAVTTGALITRRRQMQQAAAAEADAGSA